MTDQLIEQARNRVFQKIGRNVCNLQKLERLLKLIVVSTKGVHGTASELKNKMQELEESLEKNQWAWLPKKCFNRYDVPPSSVALTFGVHGLM